MTAALPSTTVVGSGPPPGIDLRFDLEADLRLDVDGRPLQLRGAGRRLTLEVGGIADLVAISRERPVGTGADDLAGLARTLDSLGVTVDVVDARRTRLATLGHDAPSGVVGRLIGGPVAVAPRGPSRLVAAVAALAVAVVVVRALRSGSRPA